MRSTSYHRPLLSQLKVSLHSLPLSLPPPHTTLRRTLFRSLHLLRHTPPLPLSHTPHPLPRSIEWNKLTGSIPAGISALSSLSAL
ncbi:unnamed protein product [Closterium sp. NIES-53]